MIVGKAEAGKSSLITCYIHNTFSEDYEPVVLDRQLLKRMIGKQEVELEIHDTSAELIHKENRKEQYKGADCFLICVPFDERKRKQTILSLATEIDEMGEEVERAHRFVLFTKSDLQESQTDIDMNMDALKQDDYLKDNITAFYTCSSKQIDDFDVVKVFNKVVKVVRNRERDVRERVKPPSKYEGSQYQHRKFDEEFDPQCMSMASDTMDVETIDKTTPAGRKSTVLKRRPSFHS